MAKRVICVVIAVVLVACAAFCTVSASSQMTVSDECIQVLKSFEGFSRTPYWDYAQYTVGYGTRCPDDMLEYYTQNGITDEEAEVLLRNHIAGVELQVNRFLDSYGVSFDQGQFDAMVSLTYNCGGSWINELTGTLHNAIIDGATGNDFIRAIALWCNAGGNVLTGLIKRRLSEANMYLNGQYSVAPPDNYCYVLFDANGGSVSPRVQGYDSALTDQIRPVPTNGGMEFAGWYTLNGERVTVLDASTKNTTLYAHWTDSEGTVIEPESNNDVVTGTVNVTSGYLNVRSGPGTQYPCDGSLSKGDRVTVTERRTVGTMEWGKIGENRWVSMSYIVLDEKNGWTKEDGNIWRYYQDGDAVTGWCAIEGTTYYFDGNGALTEGWFEADGHRFYQHLNNGILTGDNEIDGETHRFSGSGEWLGEVTESTACGTVNAPSGLRIRSGAGTDYGIVGALSHGSRVEILETQSAGGSQWGRISSGWICMDYVDMDGEEAPAAPEADSCQTGTVRVTGYLNVRAGAGTNYGIVGSLYNGNRVEIIETCDAGGITWGNTGNGWICMDYVMMDGEAESSAPASQPADDGIIATGTVQVDTTLNVRKSAGTNGARAGSLKNGTRVEIFETKTVGGSQWGRISSGWICLDYVSLDGEIAGGNSGSSTTVGTVSVDTFLNVRSKAGFGGTVVGSLVNGTRVEITETAEANGMCWGHIASGWISMDYVK